MSINLALGRPASASSYVAPFGPGRAVDGYLQPTNRWLCGTVPAWMSVNLQGEYYINRWVVKNMGIAGWQSPNYNMSSYKLQGSHDNINWFDIDIVSGNTSAVTDRTLPAMVKVNFVRAYVGNGLNINPKMASIVEFEVYGGSNPYLSNLTLSSGALSPAFASSIFAYTSTVPNSVSTIKLTPTASDSQATIMVNGAAVVSGAASQDIPLNVGTNTINIIVTSRVGSIQQAYTVVVTREAYVPYLSNLIVKYGKSGVVSLNPSFTAEHISYNANVAYNVTGVLVNPTAAVSGDTIYVNNNIVASGGVSPTINLNTGDNTITVKVVSADGNQNTIYTLLISRAYS